MGSIDVDDGGIEPSGPLPTRGIPRSDEIRQIDIEIAERNAALAQLQGRRRAARYLLFGAIVLIGAVSSAYGVFHLDAFASGGFSNWVLQVGNSPALALVLGVVATAVFLVVFRLSADESALEADIELLQSKRRIESQLSVEPSRLAPTQSGHASYFDSLVKINVDNLAEYYSLVKVHTNNSFRASLFAGMIGFVLILIGVVAGFGGATAATPAKIAAASGVLTEFIAGVFFYLYNRTVRQLKEYHDSLISVQNVLLSFKLVNDEDDAAARRDMTARMCEFLLAGRTFPLQAGTIGDRSEVKRARHHRDTRVRSAARAEADESA